MSDAEDERDFFEQLRASGEISEEEIGELQRQTSAAPTKSSAGVAQRNRMLMEDGLESAGTLDLRVQLTSLSLAERLKFAMLGNATCRSLLISDGNKLIQMAVLKNPKLQKSEIDEFSKNRNLSGTVLRAISESKSWIKDYTIKLNLVTNPKTPLDIGLRWLRHLRKTDLKKVSLSREIPQLIAVTAKKRLGDMQRRS